ncbi:MAG: hypothetical protein HYX53_14965 [Chloroflexi bacterium]|nr:hypothetical protein [Chloroflexota bacterium]
MQRAIPDDLSSIVPESIVALVLTDDELRQYNTVLQCLCQEPELEHLGRRELDGELWALTCRLYFDQSLRSTSRRNALIREFFEGLCRAWEPFEFLGLVSKLTIR